MKSIGTVLMLLGCIVVTATLGESRIVVGFLGMPPWFRLNLLLAGIATFYVGHLLHSANGKPSEAAVPVGQQANVRQSSDKNPYTSPEADLSNQPHNRLGWKRVVLIIGVILFLAALLLPAFWPGRMM